MVKLSNLTCALLIGGLSASAHASLAQQDTLTGDWGGARTDLTQAGVSLNAEYTNVYQQNVSNRDTSGNLSHRVDVFAGLDLEKLGLWSGGRLNTQWVYRDGEANDFGFFNLSAPNAGHFGDDKSTFFSSLYYTHIISPTTLVMLGKIDAFEMIRYSTFYGGGTRHGFMNLAFSAPPSGVTPPSLLGAVAMHRIGDTRITGMVYDPRDRYTDNLTFKDAFEDGVNLSLSVTQPMEWFGRNSHATVAFTYSTEEGIDLSSISLDPSTFDIARYKHNFRVELGHNLYEQGDSSWGVYLRGAIADGNPNLISGTFAGGIGGDAGFLGRQFDNWGIGYYYYDLSNDLQDSIAALPIEEHLVNESGMEAYYAYQATPWLTFTLDAQMIQPAVSSQSTDYLLGLRTNIRL